MARYSESISWHQQTNLCIVCFCWVLRNMYAFAFKNAGMFCGKAVYKNRHRLKYLSSTVATVNRERIVKKFCCPMAFLWKMLYDYCTLLPVVTPLLYHAQLIWFYLISLYLCIKSRFYITGVSKKCTGFNYCFNWAIVYNSKTLYGSPNCGPIMGSATAHLKPWLQPNYGIQEVHFRGNHAYSAIVHSRLCTSLLLQLLWTIWNVKWSTWKLLLCFCSLFCARRCMRNSLQMKSSQKWWLWWAVCCRSNRSTTTFKRNTYLLLVHHQELYLTAWNPHFWTTNYSTQFSDSEKKSFSAVWMPCISSQNICFAEEKAIVNSFLLIFAWWSWWGD